MEGLNKQVAIMFSQKKNQKTYSDMLQSIQKYIIQMDHGDNEILELISVGPGFKKSGKEFTHVIRYLFENPKNIGVKFAKIGNSNVAKRNHGLDISMLFKLYENINTLKLNEAVSQALNISLKSLEGEGKLEQLLKEKQNLRFFFIVMLWDKLYKNEENRQQIYKFLTLASNLGAMLPTFTSWCDEIPAQFLLMQVCELLKIIDACFVKLEPGASTEEQLMGIYLKIQHTCTFLSILYESNKRSPRIQRQHFIKKNLAEYFRPLDIFKFQLKKMKFLNFIRFPFMLDLDFKYKLLQIESVFEQQVNMEKNVKNGLHNLLMGGAVQLDANGNISLQGLAYLHFQINRQNILDDSMEKLGKIKHNLKNPLKIQFMGEDGSDEGGVQKEYFQLVTKQIFNPYLDMFLPKNNGRVYWFNGYSFEPPIRFQFVGMLLGLSIYNSVHLDIRFPRILYHKLLKSVSQEEEELSAEQLLEEVNEIEPQIYRSMKQIMDSTDQLEPLELYFTIELEHFGSKNVENLVEEGNEIQLTQDNKTEYIYMYCDYLLNKHIEKQFKAFKRGFDRVVDTDLIQAFSPEELETIICGNEVIDFEELEATTNYEGGYTKDTPVIKNLWELLKSLSIEEKKGFLVFCTGSDRVPLEGLKSLNFMIQKHANSSHLPTAHTCFNVFLLPEYETKELLRKNIDFIIKNNQGFGLI